MVSSKAGLLVQRPTRGSPFEQIKLRTNLSDCSLSVLSTQGNISGEFCQSSSLQWAWIQQNSGRSLQIPWKKYFQVGFWHFISASESQNQNQHDHIAASAKIASELTNVLVIPQLQNEPKSRLVKRSRRNSSWEWGAVRPGSKTRFKLQDAHGKVRIAKTSYNTWLWICKCQLYIVIFE